VAVQSSVTTLTDRVLPYETPRAAPEQVAAARQSPIVFRPATPDSTRKTIVKTSANTLLSKQVSCQGRIFLSDNLTLFLVCASPSSYSQLWVWSHSWVRRNA